MEYYGNNDWRDYKNPDEYLSHHGVLGMKWGIRRYQSYNAGYQRKGGEVGKVLGAAGKKVAEGVKKVVKAGAKKTVVAVKSLPSRAKKFKTDRQRKKVLAKAREVREEQRRQEERAAKEKAMWDNLDKWNMRLSKVNTYTNTMLNTVNNVQNIKKKIDDAQASRKPYKPTMSEKYISEALKKYEGKKPGEIDNKDLLNDVAISKNLKQLQDMGGSYVKNRGASKKGNLFKEAIKTNLDASKNAAQSKNERNSRSGSDTNLRAKADIGTHKVSEAEQNKDFNEVLNSYKNVSSGKTAVNNAMKNKAYIGNNKAYVFGDDKASSNVQNANYKEAVDAGSEALHEIIKKFHR